MLGDSTTETTGLAQFRVQEPTSTTTVAGTTMATTGGGATRAEGPFIPEGEVMQSAQEETAVGCAAAEKTVTKKGVGLGHYDMQPAGR